MLLYIRQEPGGDHERYVLSLMVAAEGGLKRGQGESAGAILVIAPGPHAEKVEKLVRFSRLLWWLATDSGQNSRLVPG